MKIVNKKTLKIIFIIIFILWILWIISHFLIDFKLIGNSVIEINCGTKYKEKGATATFFGKNLKVNVKNNININKEGKYIVYYNARNMFGISKSIKRNIVVKDKTPPTINLKGENPIILDLNETYKEPGFNIYDNVDINLNNDVKIKNNIKKNQSGEYQVIYEVTDKSNNKTKKIRKVIVRDKELPLLILKGKTNIDILLGEEYIEEGYTATDNIDGDITNNVEIIYNVDNTKLGTYEIIYKIKDSSNNEVIKKRYINVVKKILKYKDMYNKIDNKQRGWWSNNKFDHKRPTGGGNIDELKKYNAYFLGPDEKRIYLTYDEGANDTYLPQIIDVLNANNVKATFFLCRNYMLMNRDLIKKMVNSGHSIGNHTFHHYIMPTLANQENFDKYVYEVRAVEETYKEITGETMDKIYREPKGEWSFRSLQIVKDLGYKTFFYSADYLDYGDDISKDLALKKMMKRYHNGAIYLFHPKNKGNYEALEDFIKNMKKLGYKFDLIKNINY